ncbi:MAG: DUF6298 domain-containing protein [Candidatus Zipacnadales bacterium]
MIRWMVSLSVVSASAAVAVPLRVYPENPRYFLRGEEPVVLFGSGLWTIIPESNVNIREHNEWYASYGANANRATLFAFCVRKGEEGTALLAPWARTGPGEANDGRPKFNLTQWDERFWRRAHEYFADCQTRKIVVLLQMFDEPFVEGGVDRWYLNPFNPDNNINRLPGLPAGDVSGEEAFYDPDNAPLMEIQDALIIRLLDETVPRYDNLIYEIGNEINMDSESEKALAWQQHWLDLFNRYKRTHGVELLLTNDTRPSLLQASAPGWGAINHHSLLGLRVDQSTVADIIDQTSRSVVEAFAEFARPIYNSRPCSDPDRVNYPDIPNEVQGRALYWAYLMSGGHVIGFRTTLESWQGGLRAERIIRSVRRFAEHADVPKLEPHPELVQGDHCLCLADPGRRYAVYAPLGGEVRVDLSAVTAGKTLTVERYSAGAEDPAFETIGNVQPPRTRLICPSSGEGNDWAYVLSVQ